MYISREKIKELRYKVGNSLATLVATCVVYICTLFCYKGGLFSFGQNIICDILTLIMIMTISIMVVGCILSVFSFESWWRDV